jgi:hypothetical protein
LRKKELFFLKNPSHFKNIKEPFGFHEGISNGMAIFYGHVFDFSKRKPWLHTIIESLICFIPTMGMNPKNCPGNHQGCVVSYRICSWLLEL